MYDKDEIPIEEEEEISIDRKLVNEMKHLMNEITNLKIELLMVRLENIDLENEIKEIKEIKELKQKLNALYGKKGK